jgi:hypothetical protein
MRESKGGTRCFSFRKLSVATRGKQSLTLSDYKSRIVHGLLEASLQKHVVEKTTVELAHKNILRTSDLTRTIKALVGKPGFESTLFRISLP